MKKEMAGTVVRKNLCAPEEASENAREQSFGCN